MSLNDRNVLNRQTGKPLTEEEKCLILSIYLRCREEDKKTNAPLTKTYDRVCYYAGVSRKIVVEITSYYRKKGCVPPPVQAGNQSNHKSLIHLNTTSRIRQFIYENHKQGISCSSKDIQNILYEEFSQEIHLRTVQRHLNRLGFEYKKNKPKTRSLREKAYICQQRHTYLYEIKKIRSQGYSLIYLDESFLHHNHGYQFSWFEDDFLDRPSGKGKRWCFIHAVSIKGLLPNCAMIFEGTKSTGDYHGSFNFEVFHEWFNNKLLPNLPKKSCVVMDRATYHMIPEERVIPSQMRKGEIQNWLTSHSIYWDTDWLKPKLKDKMINNMDLTPVVQKEAKKRGHRLLVLPVHHPELNPIELVWAIVKNKCAKKLRNGMSFKDVLRNLQDEFDHFPQETCENLYRHVEEKEEEFWYLDLKLDKIDEFLSNEL